MSGGAMICRFLVLLIIAASASAEPFLPKEVAALMKKHKVKQGQVGIVIRRLSDDIVLVNHQAEKPFNPASLIKLFTSSMAIDVLGPIYRWQTKVAVDGKIQNGVLQGDLYFIGGGDPYLMVERFLYILNDLRSVGIRDIQGNIVIDDKIFSIPSHNEQVFDGAPLKPYNVGAGGMVVNFKATRVVFSPTDKKVEIYTDPINKHFSIKNKVQLVNGRCGNWRGRLRERYHGDDNKSELVLSGRYAKRCGEQSFYVSVLSHGAYVSGIFAALWERLGGKWSGKWQYGVAADDVRVIKTYDSPPLHEVLTAMNKFSNNVIARNIFLTLADEKQPRTEAAAQAAMRRWLNEIGIVGAVVDNGSGLSRDTRVSTGQVGHLLQFLWEHSYRADIIASLPIFGVDGTLRKRGRNKSLVGEGRLKTGSLNNVKSLGGFFRDKQGRSYAVVFLAAGVSGSRAKALQNDLLKWAYNSR